MLLETKIIGLELQLTTLAAVPDVGLLGLHVMHMDDVMKEYHALLYA
jgi:hypothetical protein